MAGYVYKGTRTGLDLFDAPEPPKRQPLQPCGTVPAYRRHLYYKQEPCELCRNAKAQYERDRTAERAAGRPPKKLSPCGTMAAHRRHERAGEPVCDACKKARRRLRNPCGTWPAYNRHKANGEPACDPCMAAMRAYKREQYAKKTGKA